MPDYRPHSFRLAESLDTIEWFDGPVPRVGDFYFPPSSGELIVVRVAWQVSQAGMSIAFVDVAPARQSPGDSPTNPPPAHRDVSPG